MAVHTQLLKAYARHTFVRSSIPLRIKVDELAFVPGQVLKFKLTFTVPCSPGDYFSFILWGSMPILTAVGPGGEGPGKFLYHPTSVVMTAANFAAAASRILFLDRLYLIEQQGTTVTFTARSQGDEYNLYGYGGTGGLHDLGVDIFQPGTEDTRPLNASINLVVYRENGTGGYERMPEHVMGPDKDGAVEIRMEELLRSSVDVEYIRQAGPVVTVLRKSRRRWYAAVWGRSGAEATDGEITLIGSPASPYIAVLGGFERAAEPRFSNWASSFFSEPGMFLTYRGRTVPREVSRQERHSLVFHCAYIKALVTVGIPGGGSTMQAESLALQARIIYDTGSVGAWTNRYDDSGANQGTGTSAQWLTGWNEINGAGLVVLGLGNPVAYEVRIRANSSHQVISEVYRFTLVDDVYQEQHIHFFSSLGAWESLRTTGTYTTSLQHTHRELQQPIPFAQELDTATGSYFAESTGAQQKLVVSTGFLPRQEYLAVLDILGSPCIRWWNGGQPIPLRIVKSAEHRMDERGTDDENLYRLDLEFQVGDPTSVITP